MRIGGEWCRFVRIIEMGQRKAVRYFNRKRKIVRHGFSVKLNILPGREGYPVAEERPEPLVNLNRAEMLCILREEIEFSGGWVYDVFP